MYAQIKGLRQNGHEVHVCWYTEVEDHNWHRFVDGKSIHNYGHRRIASIKNKFQFGCVYDYCKRNGIELVYARSYIARLRSGIKTIKTLKNREYAFREIPFIYYVKNTYFDNQLYSMKAPADESRLFIQQILHFIDSFSIQAKIYGIP